MKWPTARLGDVCRIIPGFAFKSEDWTDVGIRVVKIKNIRGDNTVDMADCDHVPDVLLTPRLSKFLLNDGDILLAMTGATAGKVGRLRTREPVLLNQRVAKIAPDTTKADPLFVWAVVSSDWYQKLFFKLADGAAQPNMSGGQIEGVEIPLPPREKQRRISSILSAYDDLIENNTRRIAILEEMARRIYEEWFVRFRFPGHENVRMVESELGLVPDGWKIAAVEDVMETLGGGTPSKAQPDYWTAGTINWYSPTDLTGAKTTFMERSASQITALGLSKSSAKRFPARSVMMTSRATLGVIAVNTTEASTNQGFITCIPSARFPLWLLFHWLKANAGVFESLATGATFKEITKGVFRKITLVVPPSSVAKMFEQSVGPTMDLVLCLERKNANLRTTRDFLLPKLISGELDVSTLPEPEAVAA